jgi:hypothetical protein
MLKFLFSFGIVCLAIVSTPSIGMTISDLVNPELIGKTIDELTKVRRGASAFVHVQDADANPPSRDSGPVLKGAGFFGTADTGLVMDTLDDTHAEALARNSLRGKRVYVGVEADGTRKNTAGNNGAYESKASITWLGKIVDGNREAAPVGMDKVSLLGGDRLEMGATGFAQYRLALYWGLRDDSSFAFPNDGDELLNFDSLVSQESLTRLFDGTITLGDPNIDVFTGDFVAYANLFNVSVNPINHSGTVSLKNPGIGAFAFDFLLELGPGDEKTLLLAGFEEAIVRGDAAGEGFVDLNPIPEPSTIMLFSSGFAGLAAWKYRKKVRL